MIKKSLWYREMVCFRTKDWDRTPQTLGVRTPGCLMLQLEKCYIRGLGIIDFLRAKPSSWEVLI
jgi:hypothetical protein